MARPPPVEDEENIYQPYLKQETALPLSCKTTTFPRPLPPEYLHFVWTVHRYPHPVIVVTAASAVDPTAPAGTRFTAKRNPWLARAHAAIQRHNRDEAHSSAIDPYPTGQACHSRARSIFGVVPEEISAWKPDIDSASNRDETERKDFAGKDRAGAVNEPGKRRQL